MPNWTENDLTIKGPKADVLAFEAKAKGKNGILDAESFIPYPKEFTQLDEEAKEQDKKRRAAYEQLIAEGLSADDARTKSHEQYPWIKDGYNRGGYEWCITHWGTKWNLSDVEEVNRAEYKDELEIQYRFNTAWSPPQPVIHAMGKAFPSLKFELRYFECGAGFNGLLRIEKGAVTYDKSGDYFGELGG